MSAQYARRHDALAVAPRSIVEASSARANIRRPKGVNESILRWVTQAACACPSTTNRARACVRNFWQDVAVAPVPQIGDRLHEQHGSNGRQLTRGEKVVRGVRDDRRPRRPSQRAGAPPRVAHREPRLRDLRRGLALERIGAAQFLSGADRSGAPAHGAGAERYQGDDEEDVTRRTSSRAQA
jgi:hypothetical protein